MDDFEKELKVGFLQEASQLLQDTEACFLDLESKPDDSALLDQIFRLAHNLKGSSKAVGFDAMGAFTHEFESLLLKIKNGEVPCGTEAVNLLLRCNDHLRAMIEALNQDLGAQVDSAELTAELKEAQSGNFSVGTPSPEVDEPQEAPPTTPFGFDENVAIDPDDLLRLMALETQRHLTDNPTQPMPRLPSEAPTEAPTEAPPHLSVTPPPTPQRSAPSTEESIRVSLDRLEKLLNFVGEMVILQSVLREQANSSASMAMRRTVDQLGKVSKEIQDISMSLRMVPVKATFQKMQRIVRDTAQALGKKVNLTLHGEETELDKTVLEHLGDPLVHIIRNAVDHGIEDAERRKESGKSETGNIRLAAYHHAGRLIIEVTDDGGGIDASILTRKAVEKGILKPGQAISEKDAVYLVFHPGFSTKSQVSEISGRGVGMDVVRTNIEKLSGEIKIETVLAKGTTFRISLPLTLAIIDGMTVRNGNDRFVIPLAHVHESIRLERSLLQYNSGFGETLILRGENLPLYRLNRLLNPNAPDIEEGIAIIVRTGEKPFAVLVDDIIGQSQIVIKRLGEELSRLKEFSGSAILGDGMPALILELPELIKKNVVRAPRAKSDLENRDKEKAA